MAVEHNQEISNFSLPPASPAINYLCVSHLDLDTNNLRGRRPVILFFNGTFNPVHPGHRQVMIAAKEFLDTHGVRWELKFIAYCFSFM